MTALFIRRAAGALLILGLLTGCQSAGTVGGAVAGGLVGSAFGSGSGKTAAIIGGSLLGGYVGNRTIDQRRYNRYNTRYRRYY